MDDLKGDASVGRIPASTRRSQLHQLVTRHGFVTVSHASDFLGVSEMTVRRDLEALQEEGLVDRTFGGAVRRGNHLSEEPAFDLRRRDRAAAKQSIALAAAALIGRRETVAIDVGTTTLALAEEIAQVADIRILTNSLRAAVLLSNGASPVYILGGQIRAGEVSVVGAASVDQMGGFFPDKLFLGASGVTSEGFFDYSIEDSEVKRAMIRNSEMVIALCDATKFERRSLVRVAGLDEIDVLVCDAEPPPHLSAALARAGVRLVVSGPPSGA